MLFSSVDDRQFAKYSTRRSRAPIVPQSELQDRLYNIALTGAEFYSDFYMCFGQHKTEGCKSRSDYKCPTSN